MGMFDWVNHKVEKCPVCGSEIREFQTKSGFKALLRVTPEQLLEDAYRNWGTKDDVEYYGYCNKGCGAFFFTYSEKKSKWIKEFLTNEELYGG